MTPELSVYSITVPRTEVTVDAVARTGQFTVDVKNEQAVLDRVVANMEAVATGGVAADPSWFVVDRHQRPIPGGGSEQFLVSVAVPEPIAPGSYLMRPVAYSADHPPDDTRVEGPTMAVIVPEPPPPAKTPPWWRKYWPWWLIGAVAAVLLVVAIVVVIIVLSGGSNNNTVTIPNNITGMSAANATSSLEALGLTVSQVNQFSSFPFGTAIRTDPVEGSVVPAHSHVTLYVSGLFLPPFTVFPRTTAGGSENIRGAVTAGFA